MEKHRVHKRSRIKDIHKLAEEQLRSQPFKQPVPGDVNNLLHELRVHQIELQMQNEELMEEQTKLEEALDKYSELYDFSPIAYLTINESSIIEEVNFSGATLLGIDQRYLLKMPFMSFVHPDDRPRFDMHLQNTITTGGTIDEELRLIGKDSSEKWIYIKSIPQEQTVGNSIRAAIIDITLFKQEQQKRQAAEETFRAISENAPDIIICFERDLRIDYVNPQMEKTSGMLRGEIIGKTCDEIGMPGDVASVWNSTLQSVFETGKAVSMETDIPIAANERTYHVIAFPEFTEDGSINHVMTISRDITDRKRAEDALKASEERFREMAGSIKGVFWLFDRDKLKIIYASPAYEEIYGRPIDTLYDQTEGWDRNIHPDDLPAAHESFIRVFRQACVKGDLIEYRIIRPDGDVRWISNRIFAVPDTCGNTRHLSGFAEDISDRKHAEEERELLLALIDQEREKLQTLVNGIADEIWFMDAQRNLVLMNPATLAALGFDPGDNFEEVLASLEVLNLDGTPRPKEKNPLYVSMEGKTLSGDEMVRHHMTGELRYRHYHAAPVRDRKGQAIGAVAVVSDITERKLMEETLRISEERYRITMDGMLDAVSIQTVREARYLYVNKAFSELTGYAAEEVIGKLPGGLDLPLAMEDRNYLECLIERSGKARLEIQYRMKDGTVLDALLACTPIQYKGEDCAVVVMTDITTLKRSEEEKKRLEIQLAQSQKMEALGTLAGGMAHDFNNLLTAIMGYTEIAMLNVSAPERVRKHLDSAFKSCKRARELVGRILTFSRHAEAKLAPISISYAVDESLTMLRSMIPSTIEIRQELAEPGKVMADPGQINQMVMNLVINASEAMAESGGVLEVTLMRETIGKNGLIPGFDLTPGPYLKLTVSDNGHGMTPEMVERIFEPYFTTRKKGGTAGMGLSIVHGIVKRHKGAIMCRSEPGKGTSFEISLPEVIIEEEPEEPVVMDFPTGSESILFVDDESSLVEVAKEILGNLGYNVTTTVSSVEALNILRNDPGKFDLVITDMVMPVMTGDKLSQTIIQIRPDIPIIMCTGYSEYISEDQAKSIGIREFIMKPIEWKDLSKTIRKVLDAG
jgi:PAS domain S-box-containing protein